MHSTLFVNIVKCGNLLLILKKKNKIIIYSKGKVTNYPAFIFGHEHIDVVGDYVYLRCTFDYNETFHKAITKQVSQAKKAYYSLMKKVYASGWYSVRIIWSACYTSYV